MDRILKVAAGACAVLLSAVVVEAHAGVDVGVSVQIAQPGVYGRVEIGSLPRPELVLPRPVIIAPAPLPPRPPHPPSMRVVTAPPPPPQPAYMWVPPGHQKDWRRHCAKYNACGVPVYFVRDDWYGRHVHPRERWADEGRRHGDHPGRGRGRDRDHDHDHGPGRGRGRD